MWTIGLILAAGAIVAGTVRAEQQGLTPAVRLAFLRDGDMYVLDAARGNETRLTDDGSAAVPWWSVDGEALFFRRSAPATPTGMWRWREASGLAPAGGSAIREHWSPDGRTAAVMEPQTGRWQPDPGWMETRVWVEQGSQRWQLTPLEPGVRWEPLAWSPDGRRLALLRMSFAGPLQPAQIAPIADASLWVTVGDLHTATLRELPLPAAAQQTPGIPDVVVWSPDGQFLIVGMGPPFPSNSLRADGTHWHLVPVDDGAAIELGSGLTAIPSVAWAPDASFVVLSAPGGRETYRNKHLVRFQPTSGDRQDLAHDRRWADLEPTVSPDGRWVAFVRGRSIEELVAPGNPTAGAQANINAIRSRRIWVMGADGSGVRQVTDALGWTDGAPVWSADGRWLVFVRWRPAEGNTPAAAQLWAVRPDGGEAQPLVTDLDLPPGLVSALGYYGAIRWWDFFAVAPGLGLSTGLPRTGTGVTADTEVGGGAVAVAGSIGLIGLALAAGATITRRAADAPTRHRCRRRTGRG
jgi:dipeptidyl aminopeptidase/acylaminoacyl peptidase